MTFDQWFEKTVPPIYRDRVRFYAELAWKAATEEAEKPKELVGVRCIYGWAGGDS